MLLEKGLKYNLRSDKKYWLVNLALEAETAITQLPFADSEYYRKRMADRIEKLQNNSNPPNTTHPEARTVKYNSEYKQILKTTTP
jgi:hypothetical protein